MNMKLTCDDKDEHEIRSANQLYGSTPAGHRQLHKEAQQANNVVYSIVHPSNVSQSVLVGGTFPAAIPDRGAFDRVGCIDSVLCTSTKASATLLFPLNPNFDGHNVERIQWRDIQDDLGRGCLLPSDDSCCCCCC
eukprot:jgi/Botrbrau1/5393/Bobra.0346s0053.1